MVRGARARFICRSRMRSMRRRMGRCLGREFGRAKTGVEQTNTLAALLHDIKETKKIWLPACEQEGRMACQDTLRHWRKSAEADPIDERPGEAARLREKIAKISAGAEFFDLSPILQRLRIIKSPAEIE